MIRRIIAERLVPDEKDGADLELFGVARGCGDDVEDAGTARIRPRETNGANDKPNASARASIADISRAFALNFSYTKADLCYIVGKNCPVKVNFMSQNDLMTKKKLGSNYADTDPSKCHIHDNVNFWDKNSVREKVCLSEDGKNSLFRHEDGHYYCLLHLPSKDKDTGRFYDILFERYELTEEKINGNSSEDDRAQPSHDFRYVWFPAGFEFHYIYSGKVTFKSSTITGVADFSQTVFHGQADFSSVNFLAETDFSKASFRESGFTTFKDAMFAKDAFFDETIFENDAFFNSAFFSKESNVFFRKTQFSKNVYFRYCRAEGNLRFSRLTLGEECAFDFQEASFEKASRVSFHTVRLHPNWFVNVDSRKFVLTDIKWQNLEYEPGNKNIEAELAALKARGIEEQRKRLLEIAARQLAVNAEENNRYEEAAKFRYLAMETKRLEDGSFFSKALVTLYKWSSGYGESWSWAALMLVGILVLFGLLYAAPLARFDYGEKADEKVIADVIEKESDWTKKYDARYHRMGVGEGLIHSLYIAALQRPDPKPAPDSNWTKLLVILETILAPLQAALLALAIRRKFMR